MAINLTYADIWKWYTYNWTNYMVFWQPTYHRYWWFGATIYQSIDGTTLNASSLSAWQFACIHIIRVKADTNEWDVQIVSWLRWKRNWTWEILNIDRNFVTSHFNAWTEIQYASALDCNSEWIQAWITEYRYQFTVFWYNTRYTYFNVSNAPNPPQWVDVEDISVWKNLVVDWSMVEKFYGKNIFQESRWSWWWSDLVRTSWETSFNLSSFQIWNVVCVSTFVVSVQNSSDWETIYMECWLEKQKNWNRMDTWYTHQKWEFTVEGWYRYWFWNQARIDYQWVWNDATNYRFVWTYHTSWWSADTRYIIFSISNLDIDVTPYKSWYLWVEWQHLCYTDAKGDMMSVPWYWYKHKMPIDTSQYEDVWTDKSWYIWIDDSWSYPNRLYYVDEYWIKRRTWAWYWFIAWTTSTSSSNSWYIRVSRWWYQADNYLCFVAYNWTKYRIMNTDLS